MTCDPVILLLDDERGQILTLRTQLRGLGRLVEFDDPKPALQFAATTPCDAAIVDIRMPRCELDGIEFLRRLREFDRDLTIIVRTADESDAIADAAIEFRAARRAIKSRTTREALRQEVQAAIAETRRLRTTRSDAAAAGVAQQKYADALGCYDITMAAAAAYRGVIHSLRDEITTLGLVAAALHQDAVASASPAFLEHASRNERLVTAIVEKLGAFVDGPFGDGAGANYTRVNPCLAELVSFFRSDCRWTAPRKTLRIQSLYSDVYLGCSSLELMNGLMHLCEFFLEAAEGGGEVSLSAFVVSGIEEYHSHSREPVYRLNRPVLGATNSHVVFRAQGPLASTTPETVRDGFHLSPASPRTGNLNVLARVVQNTRGGVMVFLGEQGPVGVDVLLPVSTA